jgi:hypothetical protein
MSIIAILLLVSSLVSCHSNERIVRNRVEKYYKAIIGKNYDISYEMELQFVRNGITKDDYIRKTEEKPVTIESFSLGEITIDGISAGVNLSLNVIFEGRKIKSAFKDIWVLENGNWYHAPN